MKTWVTFALLAIAIWPLSTHAEAAEWLRIRSAHFAIEGNAPELELRAVATRLEEFHTIVAAPTRGKGTTAVPTVVTVFATADELANYLPSLGGSQARPRAYLATSPVRNRIVLASRAQAADFEGVFREYARLMLDAMFPVKPPRWVSEGMIEFYGTFSVSADEKTGVLGAAPSAAALVLETYFLPLADVLARDWDSALPWTASGMQPQTREMAFTAESWALVHYLLLGNPARQTHFTAFIDRLAAGEDRQAAFKAAFGGEPAVLEQELRKYIADGGLKRSRVVQLQPGAAGLDTAKPETMKAADVEGSLGQLLLQVGRQDEAEARFRKALALDASVPSPHTGLGLLRVRQGRHDESLAALRKAASLAPRDAFAQLALGYGAVRAVEQGAAPADAPALLATAKTALSVALELDPNRPETMTLLAFTLATMNEDLERAQTLLEGAIDRLPAREDYALLLAELHLQRQQIDPARAIATRLARAGSTPARRDRAKSLLARLSTAKAPETSGTRRSAGAAQTGDVLTKAELSLDLRQPEPGESRARGRLVQVECSQGAVVFHVENDGKTRRFLAGSFEQVEMLSYRPEPPQVGCGPAKVVYPVILTWRSAGPADAGAAGMDGVAVALEVLPGGSL